MPFALVGHTFVTVDYGRYATRTFPYADILQWLFAHLPTVTFVPVTRLFPTPLRVADVARLPIGFTLIAGWRYVDWLSVTAVLLRLLHYVVIIGRTLRWTMCPFPVTFGCGWPASPVGLQTRTLRGHILRVASTLLILLPYAFKRGCRYTVCYVGPITHSLI